MLTPPAREAGPQSLDLRALEARCAASREEEHAVSSATQAPLSDSEYEILPAMKWSPDELVSSAEVSCWSGRSLEARRVEYSCQTQPT